jgi:DNA repair exonuclease SbcCD ATPase subunit
VASKLERHRTKFRQKTSQLRNELIDWERKLQAGEVDPHTRQRHLNEVRSAAAAKMMDLKAEYDAALQNEMRNIHRQMWALPERDAGHHQAIANYRDAVSKARAIGNADEAMALFDAAELMGDTNMLRALGLVGMSKGWGQAVHQRLYQTDERLARLMDESDEIEAATTDTVQRVQDAAMFATPTGTSEHAGGSGAPEVESVEVPAFAGSTEGE